MSEWVDSNEQHILKPLNILYDASVIDKTLVSCKGSETIAIGFNNIRWLYYTSSLVTR